MATFTTVATCKLLLGIPTSVTTHDALLTILVDVADQQIFDEINLPLADAGAVTTYTQLLDVDTAGLTDLMLDRLPVVAVTSMMFGGAAGTVVDTENYYVTDWGAIRMIGVGKYFPIGRQQVWVQYTAGFASIPSDLSHAAALLTAQHFNVGGHSGLDSERVGSYNYKQSGVAIPPIARRILAKYTRAFARP